MKLTFQIVITDESGLSRTEELISLQKSGDALNDIGLSVSESKQLLGAVQKSDCHPERRLMAHLSAQGMQANQQIFFLSDGADNLRELQFGMYPESIHVLDWFHITMRLTVLMQYAKGLQTSDPATGNKVLSLLESSKRYLWHGNIATALDRIDDCVMYCDDPELNYANLKALQKQLDEMYNYIRNNQMMIPNYGEMRRYGEPVSTAFVESTPLN